MKKVGFGRIINILSTSVKAPIPGLGVSNTIRAAVANWAKTLSIELGSHGITVNNILPGFTNTNRLKNIIINKANKQQKSIDEVSIIMRSSVPANRFGESFEVANAIAFLCTPAAAYINGINLPVDGGRTQSL
jgi:3-oxoacyl-[acyl-carrier protein] reductase